MYVHLYIITECKFFGGYKNFKKLKVDLKIIILNIFYKIYFKKNSILGASGSY
jgi:hypothetical protein